MLPLRSWHVSAIQGYVGSNCNLTRSSESWHVQNVCVYVKPTAVQLYQGPSFKLSNPHPRLSPGAMGPLSWLVSATPCKERHVLYDAFTHLQLHFVPPTNFFRRCFVIHEGTKECGVSDIIQWKNMEMLGSYLGTFWKLTKLWCLWNVAWYYINLVSPCHPTYPACMGSQLYRDINGVSNITSPGFSKSLQHVFDQLTRCLPRPRYGSCYSRCWRFFIGASPQEVLQGLAAIIGPGSTVATGIVGKAGWHAINGHNIPLLTYIDIYWSDWWYQSL